MGELKEFPISAVLSVTTGRLMGDIGEVYEILGWMSGEKLFTHQLPRVSREAAPVILAAHPQLHAAVSEAEQVTTENWQTWLSAWTDRFGAALPVPRLGLHEHRRVGPLAELAEMMSPGVTTGGSS